MTIVKVQIAIYASGVTMPGAPTPALIYDKSRTHIREQVISDKIRTELNGELKAFFEADWDGEEWRLIKRVEWQDW